MSPNLGCDVTYHPLISAVLICYVHHAYNISVCSGWGNTLVVKATRSLSLVHGFKLWPYTKKFPSFLIRSQATTRLCATLGPRWAFT
jgi:hypothetical protein